MSHNKFLYPKENILYQLLRDPKLWNEFMQKEEKEIQSYTIFQKRLKSKLPEIENKDIYFWYGFYLLTTFAHSHYSLTQGLDAKIW